MSTPNDPVVPQSDPIDPQTEPGYPPPPADPDPATLVPGTVPDPIPGEPPAQATISLRADPANAPVQTRVPLVPYTVFLFAATAKHAQNFAVACLDPQQPWTYIEDAAMLAGLTGINVFEFSDAMQHPDAAAILTAFTERYAQVVTHPDQLVRLPVPPDHVVLTVDEVAGTDDAATIHTPATSPDVNPLSLPTRG